MVALLSGDRLGESAEKSVDDGARLDQIPHRAKVFAVLDLSGRIGAGTHQSVRPG
jgi:hypothetical protein